MALAKTSVFGLKSLYFQNINFPFSEVEEYRISQTERSDLNVLRASCPEATVSGIRRLREPPACVRRPAPH